MINSYWKTNKEHDHDDDDDHEDSEHESLLPGQLNFLNNSKFITLTESITPKSATYLVDRLFVADQVDGPIKLIINSTGGDVYSTFMIYDIIKSLFNPVIGIVSGIAASGAFYVLQACSTRTMTPNSMLFWHQMIVGIGEMKTANEFHKQYEEYKKINGMLENLFKKRAKIKADVWKDKFKDNDLYFTAKQAKKYNMIDKVLTHISQAL